MSHVRSWMACGTLVLLLLAPGVARAQVSVGVSGGLSLSTLVGDDVDDDAVDRRTGFVVGGFASKALSERVALTSGLYYAQKGFEDSEVGSDFTFKLDYLEVPVLLQLGLLGNETTALSVFAGPSLAFEVGCEIEGSGGGASATVDCDASILGEDAIETSSVSVNAIVGAGVRFMTSETMFLLVNGGLNRGLTSIDDSGEDADAKNSSWFFQAGLGWILGG